MKTIKHKHGSRVPWLQIKRSAGMALVIVLASLVFLAALALAFLASVSTELRSSKVYSQGANAKLLGQTAVNLAMAQISEATKGVDGSSNTLAWASQPGMIRTYDASGNPVLSYKLYSWTDMTTSGAFDHTASANTVATNWNTQTAIYTDLNQPLVIGSRTNYPIIDGNGLTNMAAVGGNKTYGSNNIPDIEGFSVSSSTTPVASGANANPVPMPVKWLYVLENGKIVAPTTSGSGTQATVSGASSTNQIVGRIAFWADDEIWPPSPTSFFPLCGRTGFPWTVSTATGSCLPIVSGPTRSPMSTGQGQWEFFSTGKPPETASRSCALYPEKRL